MATESKITIYHFPISKAFTALQNATGVAPIGNIHTVEISENLAATPPDREWFFELVGPKSQTGYQIQTYKANATEIANVLNNHAGTSFTKANILGLIRSSDSSFIEVETV